MIPYIEDLMSPALAWRYSCPTGFCKVRLNLQVNERFSQNLSFYLHYGYLLFKGR